MQFSLYAFSLCKEGRIFGAQTLKKSKKKIRNVSLFPSRQLLSPEYSSVSEATLPRTPAVQTGRVVLIQLRDLCSQLLSYSKNIKMGKKIKYFTVKSYNATYPGGYLI